MDDVPDTEAMDTEDMGMEEDMEDLVITAFGDEGS